MAWGEDKKFSTPAAYMMLYPNGVIDLHAKALSETKLPSKIKIFALLAFSHRLNTSANLHRKNCLPTPRFERCRVDETVNHLLVSYALATSSWNKLGIDLNVNLKNIWTASALAGEE
jgi:hypothetical protein